MDVRNAARTEATNQAIAGIMASDDPAAAAAAIPQDWSIDALAVSKAAQARDQTLRANAVSDQALAAAKVQKSLGEENLQNIKDNRAAAAFAGPAITDIFAGRTPKVDYNDPFFKTSGGVKALELINDAQQKQRDYALRSGAAQRDQYALELQKKLDIARGQMFSWAQSEEGLAADPAGSQRKATEFVEAAGLPSHYAVELNPTYQAGIAGAKPTLAQLNAVSPSGRSYTEHAAALTEQASALKAQEAAQLSAYDGASHAAEALAKNEYTGSNITDIARQFLAKNPQVTTGWGPNWGTEDVIQRIQYQQKLAKEEGSYLTPAQAALTVEGTIGSFTPFDITTNDVANGLRADFVALNKLGGIEELARRRAEIAASFAPSQDKINRAQIGIQAAARQGRAVPEYAMEALNKSPTVMRANAEKALKDIDAEIAALGLTMQARSAAGEKVTPDAMAALVKRRNKAQATLDSLKE
jgi:hypothetical protein